MNTRQTIFVTLALLLISGLAVWWYLGFSLDFMSFFAAEPSAPIITSTPEATTSTTPTPTTTPEAAGPVVACTPETQSVGVGVAAHLTGRGGSGAYEWFAPAGQPSGGRGASFDVSYASAGTKKITILSTRGDGSGNVDSVECTVIVTP